MKFIITILSLSMLITLNSCMAIYGIKKEHHLTISQLKSLDDQLSISSSSVIDTISAKSINGYSVTSDLKKDLKQPLQFWVIANNVVIANKVNCYAGGFPNLKWHIQSCYANRIVYSGIRKGTIMPQIATHFGVAADTTIVVAYSHFMGRQNKRFVKECKKFIGMHPSFRSGFFNMDNVHAAAN